MCLEIANCISVPDLPPNEYFQTNKWPTAIHYVNTGMINSAYLAFLCSPLLNEDRTILEESYKLELTYLASVLFVYGQFCVSTHASSMGLFKPEVFLARAVLTNTAGLLAKPPTVLTATKDPEITEKLHQMIENG